MILIDYGETGVPVSDFALDEFLNKIINLVEGERKLGTSTRNPVVYVSTSEPVHKIRLAIAQKVISCEEVAFRFQDKIIYANKYGVISDWPEGFANIGVMISQDILKTNMLNRRVEREAKIMGL